MQLNLTNIHYTYPESPNEVLHGVTLTLPQGWTGVVGDNGCGKSTLARVAIGEHAPTSGQVFPHLLGAYCEQDCAVAPPELSDFACDYSREAIHLRDLLGIRDDWPWHYRELSCGQQKRLQVAVSLWQRPDVLVMDEPTNHLDAPAREAVARALEGFRGIGILISHDRDLLDRLVTQCVSFEAGDVRMRPGNYSQAFGQRSLEEATARAEQRDARRGQKRLEAERQRRAEAASRSEARRSKAGLDPRDHDAREKIGRYIVSGQDGRAAHLFKTLDARISGAASRANAAAVEHRYDGDVPDYGIRSKRGVLLRLDSQVIPYAPGADAGISIPQLALGSADHVGLVGPNGSGKSTLVRALVDALPDDVPLVYVPQELEQHDVEQLLNRLRRLSPADRGRVLSMVAQLNSKPEALLDGSTASPGELRKLAIAEGALDQPQLLVMDEPTNHLDLHSVEALERFLARFPGAVVLVSHDARLIHGATNARWELEPQPSGGSVLRVG